MDGAATHRRRWGDHDRYWGPFTYARDEHYRPLAAVLSSADGDGHRCEIRFSGFGYTLIIDIPQIIRPHVEWVDLSGREWAWPTTPDGSRQKGYAQIDRRDYGFSYSDGFLQVFRGRQTMDSSTDKTWGTFLPWTKWRHVRRSFYGLKGEHIATLPDTGKNYLEDPGRFDRERAIADDTPTVVFRFYDYDGEVLEATTRIEEREWRLGEGWFKWLSWFRRPRIERSLDLRFSGEVGKRKGSWKGGTIGHGVTMEPGELHHAAFERYCVENAMTFIGRARDG